jgi:tagatose 1,6-diphosphate aldolase
MRLHAGRSATPVAVPMAGSISLRVGHTPSIELYFGHIGYHVYPPARGRHYAERACRLLFPLARAHGLRTLWITCNPDNTASRRTCERLGGVLTETVPVPKDNPLHAQGDREKCRYRVEI